MIRRQSVIRFFIGSMLGLVLAALIAFNVLLVWVASGPRSLNEFTPYLERALNGEGEVQAKIGQSWLIWDGWRNPIAIRLEDVSLTTADGAELSAFPHISLGLDLLALMVGQVLPTSLALEKPQIVLVQREDRSIGFGEREDAQQAPAQGPNAAAIIESLVNPKSKSSFRALRTVELINADVKLVNSSGESMIEAPGTTFVVRRESARQINANLNTVLNYGDHKSVVSSKFLYNRSSKRLEGIVETSRLYVAELAALVYNDPVLAAMQFPVSGKVGFAFTTDGKLDALQFALDGGQGKIVHERIDGEIPVDQLHLAGKADNGLTLLTIDQLAANLDGSKLTAKGTLQRTDKGLGVQAEAAIVDVATEHARRFWPLGLAPLSREWVVTNIRDGGIPSAHVLINASPGDFDLPALPKTAIDATIELKDARIRYLAGHPELRAVNATIKVDGQTLDAAVASASGFSDTRMSDGRVLIADLVPDNPLLEITLNADAAATDIVTLLGLPMLEHAKHLNLVASKTSGRATGSARLGFYFFAKDEQGRELPITYEVNAKLAQVTTPAFLERFDIENATGDLKIDDKSLEYSGSGRVNGSDITSSKVTYHFTPQAGIDTVIDANGTVSDPILKRFGIVLPIEIKEPVSVNFAAKLATAGDVTSIEEFTVKGEGVSASGSVQLTADGKDVSRAKIANITYGRNKIAALDYETFPGGYKLHANGTSLDMQGKLQGTGSSFSFEKFPAVDINVKFDRLYAANDQVIEGLTTSLLCSTSRCASAKLRGTLGGKEVAADIKRERKQRLLSVRTENAGALLGALDVVAGMEGGVLDLGGQFIDSGESSSLKGGLSIKDYTLKDAPILARMLSLASLTGFFDTLAGKGIFFKKLDAPFTLDNDVITLKDAKTYGPAIGINATGTITFPATTLDIEGTFVPSYTLNNVVGNVPILGNILMGGEGQGVFAAKYSVKGSAEDPEVSVNPLSILTPGFLRNLFDVF